MEAITCPAAAPPLPPPNSAFLTCWKEHTATSGLTCCLLALHGLLQVLGYFCYTSTGGTGLPLALGRLGLGPKLFSEK